MKALESYGSFVEGEVLAGSMELEALTSEGQVDEDRTLREQAIANDAAAAVDVPLALLWNELVRGTCRIADSFSTASRCYLATSARELPREELNQRRKEILSGVLRGLGQKSIAYDLGLAPSTVALNARLALEAMGIETKPSRVPPLVMLAARAAYEQDATAIGTVSVMLAGSVPLRIVSIPRPDLCLRGRLPRAELSVIQGLVEGRCYAEIARSRGTSARTIANQIGAVFRRMRVSGRSELVHRLFDASSGKRPLPESAVPPMDEWGASGRFSIPPAPLAPLGLVRSTQLAPAQLAI